MMMTLETLLSRKFSSVHWKWGVKSRKTSHREVHQQNFQSIPLDKSRKVRQTFALTHRKSANDRRHFQELLLFQVMLAFSATLIRPLEPFFTLDYNLLRRRRKENLSDFSHFAFHSQRKCFIVSRPPKQLGQSANELWRGATWRVIND